MLKSTFLTMLKSPIKTGIMVIIGNFILIYLVCLLQLGFITPLVPIIFISAIGVLYSKIYKEYMTLKYFKRFAIIMFSPSLLLFVLLLLAILKLFIISGTYNDGYGWGIFFGILIVIGSFMTACFNCFVLFISNRISYNYSIKLKEKSDQITPSQE